MSAAELLLAGKDWFREPEAAEYCGLSLADFRKWYREAGIVPKRGAAVVSGEVDRYVVLKASGSRFAYVNDTRAGRTVKRYNIFKQYAGLDGWTRANKHASRLNEAALTDQGRAGEES